LTCPQCAHFVCAHCLFASCSACVTPGVYAQGFCELHSSSGGSFNGSFAFDYKLDCRPSGCPSDVRSAFKTGYVVLGVTTDDICSSFEVTTSSTVAVALDSYSDATFDDTRRRSVVGADDRVWFRVVRQSRRRCSACRGRVSLSLFLSFSLSLSLSLSLSCARATGCVHVGVSYAYRCRACRRPLSSPLRCSFATCGSRRRPAARTSCAVVTSPWTAWPRMSLTTAVRSMLRSTWYLCTGPSMRVPS
jgi:hypothetical protein